MILPHSAPRRRAWPERTASLLLPGADSRPAPAAPRRRSSRRGGLYGRPYDVLSTRSVGRGAHTPPPSSQPVPGPLVGAASSRPDRTPPRSHQAPGHPGPATAAWGHAALRGSTRVRRKSGACSGGHKGRPYAALSTWSVGRAHTPPNQPAGTTGLAAISKGRALCPPEPRRRAEPAPAFHIKYPAACPAAGLND